jgi:hypothetical protein
MQDDEKNLDEQIDRLLQEWSDEVEVPPDFQREVWRRVEQAGPSRHAVFEKMAWWLLRPMREVTLFALVVLFACLWGVTHPPSPEYNAHDAYLLSISPFDPHHYEAFSP